MSDPAQALLCEALYEPRQAGDDLCRGDVLVPSAYEGEFELPASLAQETILCLLVTTQTCDLVRGRSVSGHCNSRYIGLAAVLAVASATREFATARQDERARRGGYIRGDDKSELNLFINRLIKNNEPGYFYLPISVSHTIPWHGVAFLDLAHNLDAIPKNYDNCLSARVCGVNPSFQAKLGWLMTSLSARVATADIDGNLSSNDRKRLVRSFFDGGISLVKELYYARFKELMKSIPVEDVTPELAREKLEEVKNEPKLSLLLATLDLALGKAVEDGQIPSDTDINAIRQALEVDDDFLTMLLSMGLK